MSSYTRIRHSPQGQCRSGEKRLQQIQHNVVPCRRADGVDQPFPKKPVSHRRPLLPRTKDSLDLEDFEKIAITKQPGGRLPPREHHSNDTRETNGSRHPGKDSHRLPRGELQLSRAIHEKELMLQEKLWRVEEKVRQKLQRDSADATEGDSQTRREERHDRDGVERGRVHTKTRSRETMIERRQEDVDQPKRRQDQRNEDSTRNTHQEERAPWQRRGREKPQSQKDGSKGTREMTAPGQDVSGGMNKSRWENVKEHTRGKTGDEKDIGIWARHKDLTKEGKYWQKTHKGLPASHDEQDVAQMTQKKISRRAATENYRHEGRKLSEEPLLPPVSSPSQEFRLKDRTYDSLQLLPCKICNRKFSSERLEVHVRICNKVKQSHRQVFNSYANRTKGSEIAEFWKTHSKTKTPEVLKKKNPKHILKANTRNLREGRLPAGTSHPKASK